VSSLEHLQQLLANMRASTGCPWSRAQTMRSLIPHTQEEIYELFEAIEQNDIPHIKEELSDLLFHVMFYTQIATEQNRFTLGDLVSAAIEKQLRRKPHLNGATHTVTDPETAAHLWEVEKAKKRSTKDAPLADISQALPALTRSVKLLARAAHLGFEWPSTAGALQKVQEEYEELCTVCDSAGTDTERTEEIGDLLLAIVNLARMHGIDPETALRGANRKFTHRFEAMHRHFSEQTQTLSEQSLSTLLDCWNTIKKQENFHV